jgi:hypothetical protein
MNASAPQPARPSLREIVEDLRRQLAEAKSELENPRLLNITRQTLLRRIWLLATELNDLGVRPTQTSAAASILQPGQQTQEAQHDAI